MARLARMAGVVVAALVLGPVGVAAASTGGTAPAEAADTCTYTPVSYPGGVTIGYSAVCTYAKYRIVVECEDELRGSYSHVYGNYVPKGNTSLADCPYEGDEQFLATGYSVQTA